MDRNFSNRRSQEHYRHQNNKDYTSNHSYHNNSNADNSYEKKRWAGHHSYYPNQSYNNNYPLNYSSSHSKERTFESSKKVDFNSKENNNSVIIENKYSEKDYIEKIVKSSKRDIEKDKLDKNNHRNTFQYVSKLITKENDKKSLELKDDKEQKLKNIASSNTSRKELEPKTDLNKSLTKENSVQNIISKDYEEEKNKKTTPDTLSTTESASKTDKPNHISSKKRNYTNENEINSIKKSKIDSKAPLSVLKCEEAIKLCQLNTQEFLSMPKSNKVHNTLNTKDSPKVNPELPQNHNQSKLVEPDSTKIIINNAKTENDKNSWKNIQDLDDKISTSKKAIKAQIAIVKKLQSEYENELIKLKEMKVTKKSQVKKREEMIKDLQNLEEESSDDDVEIIEREEIRDVIDIGSSSDSESSSDETKDVNNSKLSKSTEIKEGNKPISSLQSTKSPSQGLSESLQLVTDISPVEPKLDTILVSNQEQSFITDLKVFNNRLFIGGSHGILRQYDMKTHETVIEYFGHHQLIHSILLTTMPFGARRLFSGGFDNNLLIHDIDTAIVVDSFKTTSPIMCLSECNDVVYISTSGGIIFVYSLRGRCQKKEFRVSQGGLSCITSTKEALKTMLFVGTNDGEISVWDPETHLKVKNISVHDHVGVPIGFITLIKQRLLVYSRNSIHFIYYASERSPITINHYSKNNSLCMTKNYVIIGNTMGLINVLRKKGSCIMKIPLFTFNNTDSPIISLTFYNNTIISGDKKGNVYFNRLIET